MGTTGAGAGGDRVAVSGVDATERKLIHRSVRDGLGCGGLLVFVVAAGMLGAAAADAGGLAAHPLFAAMAGVGLLFAVVVLVRGFAAAERGRRAAAAGPDRWFRDHAWDPGGSDATFVPALGALALFVVVWLLLLSPLVWDATPQTLGAGMEELRRQLHADPGRAAETLLAPTFLALLAATPPGLLAYNTVRAVRLRRRYGRPRFEFDTFPFFLGEAVAGRLRLTSPRGGFDRLSLTLRCIEERTVRVRRASGTRSERCAYQLYSDTRLLEKSEIGASSEIPVHIPLPAGGGETQLRAPSPRYWELDVQGEASDGVFAATFLVPVYARGGPTADGAPAPRP